MYKSGKWYVIIARHKSDSYGARALTAIPFAEQLVHSTVGFFRKRSQVGSLRYTHSDKVR